MLTSKMPPSTQQDGYCPRGHEVFIIQNFYKLVGSTVVRAWYIYILWRLELYRQVTVVLNTSHVAQQYVRVVVHFPSWTNWIPSGLRQRVWQWWNVLPVRSRVEYTAPSRIAASVLKRIPNIIFQPSLGWNVIIQPPILFAAALRTNVVPNSSVLGCSGTGQHRGGEVTVQLGVLAEEEEN